jgi:Sjoegren syndrome nuclear autoantigen 1
MVLARFNPIPISAGIEDLREKREEILKQLREDESEKAKIQQDLQLLTKRLAQVNDSIARKVGTVKQFGLHAMRRMRAMLLSWLHYCHSAMHPSKSASSGWVMSLHAPCL